MSSSSEQCTPFWKVNLTDQLNQAYRKNYTKNQQLFNFEEELEQRLNFIPIQREQISTNKKNKPNTRMPVQKALYQQHERQKNTRNQHTDSESQNNTKTKAISKGQRIQRQIKLQRLNFDTQQQVSGGFQNFFTDKKVIKFFNQHFYQQQDIGLSEFVQACFKQFFTEKQITRQLKPILIQECRSLFCTTDENIISLNAIEMLTKKNELRTIILQKLLQVKYTKRKQKMQKQYEQIFAQIIEQQKEIQTQQQRLNKKKAKLQLQEKQLKKKQNQLKTQEKQLIEKQKQLKKILEEKFTKLTEQLNSQFEKSYKQLQKKASSFERNARNKMQLIEKRANDYLKTIHQRVNTQKQSHEQTSNKKQNNELYLLKNKLRKTQKELENFMLAKSKQFQLIENQSTSLLKANTLLESKLQKSKSKVKQLSQILVKTNTQLKEVKQDIVLKRKKIQDLQGYILQLQHHLSSNQNTVVRSKPIKAERPSQKTRKQSKYQGYQQQSYECSQCQMLLHSMNNILGLIMKGFDTQSNQFFPQNSPTLCLIEEVLINQADQILFQCTNIFWSAVQINLQDLNYTIRFMLKLFLAKFSHLRFQSINDLNTSQHSYNQIEQFAQKVSSNQLNTDQQISIEQKLKSSSAFLLNHEAQKSIQNLLNYYLILLVLGIEETFNLKTNRLELILTKILNIIATIQHNQSRTIQKTKIIKRLCNEELMAYLFWKYMSYSTSLMEVSIFMDLLIELCNLHSLNDISSMTLFKSIFALENYKHLINFLIFNFTQKNLQKNNQQLRETLQKVSIILQRFCYSYKEKIIVSKEDIQRLKKIIKQINVKQQFDDSMFKANMKSIIETLCFDSND